MITCVLNHVRLPVGLDVVMRALRPAETNVLDVPVIATVAAKPSVRMILAMHVYTLVLKQSVSIALAANWVSLR